MATGRIKKGILEEQKRFKEIDVKQVKKNGRLEERKKDRMQEGKRNVYDDGERYV